MSYFPLLIEIAEGEDEGVLDVVYQAESLPRGVAFRVLRTSFCKAQLDKSWTFQ